MQSVFIFSIMKISARFLVGLFVLYMGYGIWAAGYFVDPLTPRAEAASVPALVKKMQARYDSTAGFHANFTQEVECYLRTEGGVQRCRHI
jgi:outer membrane lipoprotein-sorting protein